MRTHTVTVLRPGGRDRFGDLVPGTTHQEHEVMIAPRPESSEDNDRGESVIVGLTLYTPFTADIRATDRVRVDDLAWLGVYDVVGEPGAWENPFSGHRPGKQVALVKQS